jgi:hypothetical protein
MPIVDKQHPHYKAMYIAICTCTCEELGVEAPTVPFDTETWCARECSRDCEARHAWLDTDLTACATPRRKNLCPVCHQPVEEPDEEEDDDIDETVDEDIDEEDDDFDDDEDIDDDEDDDLDEETAAAPVFQFKEIEDPDVSSNGQKVYLHSHGCFCLARLCQGSAEFWDKGVEAKCRTILGCAFEQFQIEVKITFGVDVEECHRPIWSKPPPIYAVGEPQLVGVIPERQDMKVKSREEIGTLMAHGYADDVDASQ